MPNGVDMILFRFLYLMISIDFNYFRVFIFIFIQNVYFSFMKVITISYK